MVETFTREVTVLKGDVHGPQSAAQAIETVITLLHGAGGNEIIAWSEQDLPLPGLLDAIREANFRLLDPVVPSDPTGRKARMQQLAAASAGLTGALGGLADTGTLVVASGPSRPRLASLLPPMHIALLPVATLYPDLPAFLAAHSDITRAGSNVVLITGPSRSSDIEFTPTLGVHGPKTLHVVLIQ
ncbi:MAG TPA: lactate utilization protein [Anaerolineae bacterium]|nr:lactate utilization protein [Anaerolineae bacterium]